MMAQAAVALGVPIRLLAEGPDVSAAQVVRDPVVGDYRDLDTLRAVTDRIAVLVNKKIVVGTIDELRKNDDPWIKDYFSGVRGRAALGMET